MEKLIIELMKENGIEPSKENIARALEETKDMDYEEMKEYFLN